MNVDIECVIYSLEEMERRQKPLEAKEELRARLEELSNGRTVPLVVFNCLDFTWRSSGKRRYPQGIVSSDPKTSICKYFEEETAIVMMELENLGAVDLRVIVPDSEVLDERVFSFQQSREERMAVALNSRIGLDSVLSYATTSLWSQYCYTQGLKSPLDYTTDNYDRIQKDPKLQKKVRDQVKDSTIYFQKNGISLAEIDPKEVLERTTWYLAMYMGEGQALLDSRAIVVNLEDRRVAAWFQRGADGRLPIITPVDPNQFYAWRKEVVGV